MVLPSDYHWALRGWMRSHGVAADEAAGVLIVRHLDGLLRLSRSPRRLTTDERALVKEARARFRAKTDEPRPEVFDALQDALGSRIHALLLDVCEALGAVGVLASPGLGLGVALGDEIFDAYVHVDDTARLYELMRGEGFKAEPDWDAEPFRNRPWPEGDAFELTKAEALEAQRYADQGGLSVLEAREIIFTAKLLAAKEAGQEIDFRI